jgi:gas vesicle protein
MGSGPDEEVDEIRKQIDESRENLGQAVGGLAYKADVKNRGKEVLEDKKEAVMEKVDELKSKLPTGGDDSEGGLGDKVKDKLPSGGDVSEKVGALKSKVPDTDALKDKLPDGVSDAASKIADKTPSKDDVKQKAQGAAGVAADHPIAVVAGAAAAGLAAGLAVPETELERQKLKPHAQQARAEITGRVQETVQQVKSGAQDAAGSVADAVKEQGQQQGGKLGEVAEKAADKTQEQVNPDS